MVKKYQIQMESGEVSVIRLTHPCLKVRVNSLNNPEIREIVLLEDSNASEISKSTFEIRNYLDRIAKKYLV